MKKFAFAALALVASQAMAQQAKLDAFPKAREAGFSVLVPGAVPPPVSLPEAVIAPEPDSALLAGFEGLTEDSFDLEELPDRPYIPSWMRGGRSPFVVRTNYVTPAFADPDCLTSGYFPRYGISGEAQSRRRLYFNDVLTAACEAGVPVALFDALVSQESRYQPYARSNAGAMGMAQLMPGTARYLGVSNPWDVRENLRGGARYLKEQLDRFGTWDLALAAYNSGPGNVQKHGGIPPFSETRTYVRTIMATIDGSAAPAPAPVRLAANPFRRVQLASFSPASQIPEY
ncbi:MAG: lytic transglycosylase domain-containing protein [Verrucomicrobiales bacterium]|jgi:hypothetical protein|nr:lytic transglycosylase domain-containing protein [Verrucomicrobiales bacterium]|tara:strand:- start:6915 stop:7775 length:861 start_codon:yes stop_codon:yes gene_type:complete